ncbi:MULTISPECIES: photosystem II cytochrome PsbV2 [unclassified Leptolyngbya]|uniref:photosystem II cytochrome PsbV2 n=1 Tax=unclassified Leptolyngbya TaxID=2650499 RepID=UPI0016894233|nr:MULTISPECIES: photosystem II cytochrome PsbV2 [unclassified Leptolyngbya]MBD1913296.1 photosystem II cytochrome PsbV2 [Leptolyngbya sp. FACHB-8]MBD2154385.1 photosystem II cytochrome PsbV2 [Leptolyngbya sp. FACHB-16]
MLNSRMCRILLGALGGVLVGAIALFPNAAWAAGIDPYVARYFDAREPVALPYTANETRSYTAQDLSQGKQLFEANCLNCHVGGITLPDPTVTLSLESLQQATPSRDTVQSLVNFSRQPMTYDGSEESIWCRQVSSDWMDDKTLENLAAFLLRAAEKAPGWGSRDPFQ